MNCDFCDVSNETVVQVDPTSEYFLCETCNKFAWEACMYCDCPNVCETLILIMKDGVCRNCMIKRAFANGVINQFIMKRV